MISLAPRYYGLSLLRTLNLPPEGVRNTLVFTAEILMHSFVTTRLDFGNSLLYGGNIKCQNVLKRLQSVQNAAARAVTIDR